MALTLNQNIHQTAALDQAAFDATHRGGFLETLHNKAGVLPALALVGLALLPGCAQNVPLADLPRLKPADAQKNAQQWVQREILVPGTLTLVKDDSYGETITTLMPVGKVLIPMTSTHHHTVLWYDLVSPAGGTPLRVLATCEPPKNALGVAGQLKYDELGNLYLKAERFAAAERGE